MSGLLAGAAVADITPHVGAFMDGYGARTEPSQGVHDPLEARALVLEHEGNRCAVISCDLLGMHPWIVARVRESAMREAGIPAEAVAVCATHNHAGPVGLRRGMFARLDESLAETVADKMAAAIALAHETRRPAVLKLGAATVDSVAMNRRDHRLAADPALRVLLVDGEDGPPVATVINFACHATVLNATNLLLSGEFPAEACHLLQRETGAPALYLNGACGDVNPAWVRQDYDDVERVGQVIGAAALRVVGELRTLGPGQRAHNIRWDEYPELPVAGRIVTPRLAAGRTVAGVPLREFEADETYASAIAALEEEARPLAEGSDERRDAMAKLTRTQAERWAAAWARRDEKRVEQTEVQYVGLGDGAGIVALPGEFFGATAEAIRQDAGLPDALVACYANDYVGYVIPPDAYDEGGYEAGITFCAPEAEGIVRDAAVGLMRQVEEGG